MSENLEPGSSEKGAMPEQIDILRFLSIFLRGFRILWWTILLLAVLAGGFFALRSWRSYTPMYKSSVSFSVELAETSGYTYSYYYNSSTASQMAATFPYILESDLLIDLVKEELGTSYINGTISAQSVADTNLFILTVTSSSAQDAYDILQAVIIHYSDVSDYVIGDTQLTLIEEAVVADAPYNSPGIRNAALKGAVFGVILGLLLILIGGLARGTICRESEIEDVLNVRSFGSLPQVIFKKHRTEKDERLLLTDAKIPEGYRESVRSCALALEQELRKQKRKIVLFTSSSEGEGVSSAAENLAEAFSEMDCKVLLLEGDLTSVNSGAEGTEVGLDDLLYGGRGYEQALRQDAESSFLRLGCRSKLRERAILSRGQEIGRVLSHYAEKMDYIFIDAPACTNLSQTAIFARHADAIVFVIRQDSVPVRRIAENIEEISSYGAVFSGCILNGMKESRPSYGYGYHYRYGYGSRYGSRYGSHYGSRYGSRYGSHYGSRYGSRYGTHYGSRYGSRYGSHYGYGYGYDPEDGTQEEAGAGSGR